MRPYEKDGQVHLPKRRHPQNGRVAMWGVGIICALLITSGWIYGVNVTVRDGVRGAGDVVSGAGGALLEVRSRTQEQSPDVPNLSPVAITPYLEAAEERMQALDLVSDIVKERIESPEGEQEPGEEAPSNSPEPPPAKATPPDVSPPPTE